MTAHQDAQEGQQTASPAGVASVPTVDAAAVLRIHRPRVATRARDNGTRWLCDECGQPWNVDGCEAVLLARRVALLEGLLRAAQIAVHAEYCSSEPGGKWCSCGEYLAALADGEAR